MYPPRFCLGNSDTPLIFLQRASKQWGKGRRIWCKRDDLTGTLLSGNKVRKLEFIAADAIEKGCGVLISAGAQNSNHCRATAAVAAQLGLKCELILRQSEADAGGNYLLDQLLGAKVTLVSSTAREAEMNQFLQHAAEHWIHSGENPHVIPIGGSDALGIWGYIRCAEELKKNTINAGINKCVIVHATGSGGTQAGLNIGVKLYDFPAEIVSYAVSDDNQYFINKVQKDWLAAKARFPQQLPNMTINSHTRDHSVGPGYGKAETKVYRTIHELAKMEGIILDPVYTGKAFQAMIEDLSLNRFNNDIQDIIFIHTGGIFGLFPHTNKLLEAM